MNNLAHDINCTCNQKAFTVNVQMQRDPTHTLTLRNRFIREMNRRYKALMRAIRISIVDNDAFGFSNPSMFNLEETFIAGLFLPAPPNSFAFATDSAKITAFNAWLNAQIDTGILETVTVRGTEYGWTSEYIQTAYQKGIVRGRAELRRAGVPVPSDEAISPIAAMFNQPFHSRVVRNIYTRTFEDLKDINRVMSTQISEVLSAGLAQGKNPKEIAKLLNKRVENIGLARSKTLARTEIIRAHHLANVEEYTQFGTRYIQVKAEWVIAGFNTCPICASMDGRIFDIDVIKSLIPAHPNCRCVAIPVTPHTDLEQAQVESEARKSENIEWWESRSKNPRLSERERKSAEKMVKRLQVFS